MDWLWVWTLSAVVATVLGVALLSLSWVYYEHARREAQLGRRELAAAEALMAATREWLSRVDDRVAQLRTARASRADVAPLPTWVSDHREAFEDALPLLDSMVEGNPGFREVVGLRDAVREVVARTNGKGDQPVRLARLGRRRMG